MNWLARLKKSECVPETDTTKPTKRVSVVSVAPIPEPFQKSGGDRGAVADSLDNAANDDAAPWRVSFAPGTPADALARMRAASLALDKVQAATPPATPDASCWPHSTAMNGAELDTFTARLALFTDRGLILADAEALADKLAQRDREADDRRVCLECGHLRTGGRCGNWQQAGVAIRARDAQLPGDFTTMLQRCDGFNDQHHQGGHDGKTTHA
jgi:hypothetical protein